MIELEQVTKAYRSQTVLSGLTFSVPRGEIVGLLGPNGAGKTTTIRLINGVVVPDDGTIRVAGLDPVSDGDAVRAMSGILTESAGFYGHMSGLENLRFYAELYGVSDTSRPARLLEEFGLAGAGGKPVTTYSTGMKKRLGLAKALLHRPQILFLDEPTSGLDPEGIQLVLTYIRRLNREQGTTVLLCSHVLHQIETVCHRFVIMEKGTVLEQGTLAELESRYLTTPELLVETDAAPDGDSYHGIPFRREGAGRLRFTLPAKSAAAPLLRALAQEASVYSAEIRGRDLETLYFRIRGERHE